MISEVVPLFLSGYAGRIDQVRMWQRNHVPRQPSAENLTGGCGFGLPCDPTDALDARGGGWGRALRQSAEMVAAGLGVTLDEYGMSAAEYAAAPEDLFLAESGLTISKGSAAGVHWQFTGSADGRPFYQMNVEMTAALGLGTGWRVSEDEPNWRIEILGTPDLITEITMPDPGGDAILLLNAARAANAVSSVVEAPAGVRTTLDMPAPTGSAASGKSASGDNRLSRGR
jgi:4-hydroxy-tetrahydrodipicolinate reductase